MHTDIVVLHAVSNYISSHANIMQTAMITFATQQPILSYPFDKYWVKRLDGMIDSFLPSWEYTCACYEVDHSMDKKFPFKWRLAFYTMR